MHGVSHVALLCAMNVLLDILLLIYVELISLVWSGHLLFLQSVVLLPPFGGCVEDTMECLRFATCVMSLVFIVVCGVSAPAVSG